MHNAHVIEVDQVLGDEFPVALQLVDQTLGNAQGLLLEEAKAFLERCDEI